MPVPLIVLTNGRMDCVQATITSAQENLTGVSTMVIVDTSMDTGYGAWLEQEFIGGPYDGKILHIDGDPGYWQAMQAVWRYARHLIDFLNADSVFFLEDDFTFNAQVDLTCLDRTLDAQPHLTQIALVRQPWWENEHAHGGLIEALEAQGQVFMERTDGRHWWIEHRACFTGNPSVIPRRTFEKDWPEGAWSEAQFGRLLFSDPGAYGAYWGRRTDSPRVTHIGHERAGTQY